jgi:hypothetical protein
MAAVMGNSTDAAFYAAQANEIRQAFNARFFDNTKKLYATGSQTAMAMPLCVGLVNEADRKAVFANLVDSIKAGELKLTAGDIGFHFLVQALQDGGASQLLYGMNNRDDVPGYGYQLKKGATALTESWQALKEVSNNHLMLGHLMEWLYAGLAGINQADASTGYRRLVIRPQIVNGIDHVRATYASVYGDVTSEWDNKTVFTLKVIIPANTTADIYLPATATSWVKHNNEAPERKQEGAYHIISVGSGVHTFSVEPGVR